jgi:hypothetical protein
MSRRMIYMLAIGVVLVSMLVSCVSPQSLNVRSGPSEVPAATSRPIDASSQPTSTIAAQPNATLEAVTPPVSFIDTPSAPSKETAEPQALGSAAGLRPEQVEALKRFLIFADLGEAWTLRELDTSHAKQFFAVRLSSRTGNA